MNDVRERAMVAIMIIAAGLLTGCQKDSDVPNRVTSESVVDRVKAALFVQDVRWYDREWSKTFTQSERPDVVRAALDYLHPAYSCQTHQRAWSLALHCDATPGAPSLRNWLRLHANDSERGQVEVLADIARGGGLDLPEWFDIFAKWVYEGERSEVLSGIGVNPGIKALDWHACDQGSVGLWSRLSTMNDFEQKWQSYFGSEKAESCQREWREQLPIWLKAHPESRKIWVRQFYSDLKRRLLNEREETDRALLQSTLESLRNEFTQEYVEEQ